MTLKNEHLPAIAVKPFIMPVAGVVLGLLVWVIDAVIDVYVLGEEQALLENILSPDESTELWMRILVVIVFFIMGMFSRHVLCKHIELDRMLLEYQRKLEGIVEQRTQELVGKTKQLEVLASTDHLTGLANRRKFNDELEKEMERFQRYGQPFCIMLADIDYFKSINDAHGHDIGDKVIVQLASTLESGVRRSDTVGRWGGEEFVLLNVEVSLQQALKIAENIRSAISQTDYEFAGKITASVGVAEVGQGDTIEKLIKRADQALYAAKNKGRNCVVSNPELNQAA